MISYRKNTVKIGLFMFITIVAFFLATKLLGWEKYTELRLFNIVIVLYFSNRLAYLNLLSEPSVNYLKNLGSVFLANLLNVALCAISFFIYLSSIDPGLIKVIEDSFLLGHHLSAGRVVMAILIEGLASSIIVSFGVLQYWKSYKVNLVKPDCTQSELG